jgi:flagellar hook protein FlgE
MSETNPTVNPDYVRHNHELLENISNHRNTKLSLEKFKILTLYGAVFVVAAGFAILLILWGISIFSNPKIIEVPVVTEKIRDFSPNIILPNTQTNQQEIQTNLEELSDILPSTASTNNTTETRSYSVFNSKPFDKGGFSDVTTGWKYNPANFKHPISQHCYVEKENSAGGSKGNFILGRKTGNTPAELTRDTDWKVIDNNVDIAVLLQAQRLCNFIRGQ